MSDNGSLLRSSLAEPGLAGRFADYTPDFRLDQVQEGVWWVRDREVQVGLVYEPWHSIGLINFWPGEQAREEGLPAVFHSPTDPSDRLTMALWPDGVQATVSEENRLSFGEGGETLSVRFEERFPDGMTSTKEFTFAVDPDYGYVLHVEAEVESPTARHIEMVNFLPQGVIDDRPGLIRYPFILWEHPDGRVLRWNQNNVAAFTLGGRDHWDRRRIATGGFLGYFGETERCPVLEIEAADPPMSAATCHNMLDEHIAWLRNDEFQPPQNGEGRYVYTACATQAALPGVAGEALAKRAMMLDLLVGCQDGVEAPPGVKGGVLPTMRLVPFRQRCTCDFSERLDPTAPDRVQAWVYPDDDRSAPVSVVSSGGLDTAPCLHVQAHGEKVAAGPESGCPLHLTADVPHRFSGWVKTKLTEGQAYLRAWEWIYTPRGLQQEHMSAMVGGESDWTYLEIDFTPTGERVHCVNVEVVVEGEGEAWFDELRLEVV